MEERYKNKVEACLRINSKQNMVKVVKTKIPTLIFFILFLISRICFATDSNAMVNQYIEKAHACIKNDPDAALELFQKAVELNPSDSELYYDIGVIFQKKKSFNEAIKWYQTALQYHIPSYLEMPLYANIGYCYKELGSYPNSLDKYFFILNKYPDNKAYYILYFNVGFIYDEYLKDYNKAAYYYKKFIKSYPGHTSVKTLLNNCEAKSNWDFIILKNGEKLKGVIVEGCLSTISSEIEKEKGDIIFQDDGDNIRNISKKDIQSHWQEKKGYGVIIGEEAVRIDLYWHDIISADQHRKIGDEFGKKGEREKAISEYKKSLIINPNYLEARLGLANIYVGSNENKLAIEEYEKVIKFSPSNISLYYYSLAVLNYKEGQKQRAIECLEGALKDPLLHDETRKKSIKLFGEITREIILGLHEKITRYPNTELFNEAYGWFKKYQETEDRGAVLRDVEQMFTNITNTMLAYYNKLLKENPADSRLYYSLGKIYNARRENDKAINMLKRAIELRKDDIESLLLLANIYQENIQLEQAEAIVQEGLNLNPNHSGLIKIKEYLNNLKYVEATVEEELAARYSETKIGRVNGLSINQNGTGNIFPILSGVKPGRDSFSVNGIPFFDIYMIISMKESLDYVKYAVDGTFPKNYDVTLSFDNLYAAKAGDSAGVAFSIVFISALQNRPVFQDVAVTGSIRLDGNIKAVGGVAEKIRGAYRNKMRKVLIPLENVKSLRGIDMEILKRVEILAVSNMDEVMGNMFPNYGIYQNYEEIDKHYRMTIKYLDLGNKALAKKELQKILKYTSINVSAKTLLYELSK